MELLLVLLVFIVYIVGSAIWWAMIFALVLLAIGVLFIIGCMGAAAIMGLHATRPSKSLWLNPPPLPPSRKK